MVHLPAVGELAAVCMDRYEFPNRKGQVPRTEVTWGEADASCRDAGKRLCTSAEWTRACSGPPVAGVTPRAYSYGATRDAGRCNTPREDGGPPPGEPLPLVGSGTLDGCRSPEGVFDLNGNVSEWVADAWTHDHGPMMTLKANMNSTSGWRVVRGGTMWSRTPYGQSCASSHGHTEDTRANDDGFRCCADP